MVGQNGEAVGQLRGGGGGGHANTIFRSAKQETSGEQTQPVCGGISKTARPPRPPAPPAPPPPPFTRRY